MVYMFRDEDSEQPTCNYRGQDKAHIEQNYLLAIDDEAGFYEKLVEKFGDDFVKMKRYDRVDFKSTDDKVYIEFKKRRVSSNTYPSLIIGQDKIQFFDELMAKNPSVRCYYINEFIDGCVLSYKYKPRHKGGWETSTHMKQPLYHIPVSSFKPFDTMRTL